MGETDLISRQAAIDAVSKACFELRGVFGSCEDALKALPSVQPEPSQVARDIATIIENEQDMMVIERNAQQWIPCSERLPEYDGEMYLVTDYCEQINRRRIHVSYCYVNQDGFWSDVPLGYTVIAWMPLPDPYKEEKL